MVVSNLNLLFLPLFNFGFFLFFIFFSIDPGEEPKYEIGTPCSIESPTFLVTDESSILNGSGIPSANISSSILLSINSVLVSIVLISLVSISEISKLLISSMISDLKLSGNFIASLWLFISTSILIDPFDKLILISLGFIFNF